MSVVQFNAKSIQFRARSVCEIIGENFSLDGKMKSIKSASVENEYEKDEKLKRGQVETLLQWVEKQPHLPKVTELQAILFLQTCYYSMESAKKALDIFFSFRTLCSDLFCLSTDDEMIKMTMENNLCSILPQKSPEGYTIILKKYINHDPKFYNFKSHLTFFDMVYTAHLNRHGSSKGVIFILDLDGGTFAHFLKVNLMAAKKYFYYLQESLPVRFKSVHFLNIVPFMDKVMTAVKPLFNKEFTKMFHFYNPGAMEGLYDYVPQSLLPKEYGGQAPSIPQLHEETTKLLLDSADFFEALQNQRVDESLRPAQVQNDLSIFGISGSFKKLDLD